MSNRPRSSLLHPRWVCLLSGLAVMAGCTSTADDAAVDSTTPTSTTGSDEAGDEAGDAASTVSTAGTSQSTPSGAEEGSTDDSLAAEADGEAPAQVGVDRAYYILPPGNYGGLPTNDDSLDQLEMYAGLAPLRDEITDADLDTHFVPQNFEPIGATRIEDTGRDGVEIIYDEFGVPHITGETRDDVSFGAGWATARDRGLWLSVGRAPARLAIADVPGVDAFGVVTEGVTYEPSAQTEALVDAQVELLRTEYGEEGEQVLNDAQAYADGINAYLEANDSDLQPFTVNDVIAVTAFIGSIFGAGGGSEVSNTELLDYLTDVYGAEEGRARWEQTLPTTDVGTPTTLEDRFDYPVIVGPVPDDGEPSGSVRLDAWSVNDLGLRERVPSASSGASPEDADADADVAGDVGVGVDEVAAVSSSAAVAGDAAYVRSTGSPPGRLASNWLLVGPERSVNGTTLAVMGPQLGYYYPEIVQQMHLTGPDFEAQGAAVPGLAMYLLIGRTDGYAWSLTSANHDVRDVFVEKLCEPNGSPATVESNHYMFDGECTAFENFDAGTLDGESLTYPVSVHGPVVGTATVDGEPVALTRQRSTFGRDGLNLVALKRMTEGVASTSDAFFETANQFGYTFNWGYANNAEIAYFSSGRLPVRADGVDRRLPTWGTGEYEWTGFLAQDEHPHSAGDDLLLNWNNQSAPGFIHDDSGRHGAAHRVELFDQWPDQIELTDVVGVMNRAANEDVRGLVWPQISEVLSRTDPPTDEAAQVKVMLDAWVADDAPVIDADDDGYLDQPAPGVMQTVIGSVAEDVFNVSAGGPDSGSGTDLGVIEADLTALTSGQTTTEAPRCGDGEIEECSAELWEAIDGATTALVEDSGDDVSAWRFAGPRTSFTPNLIPEDFPSTNRPTYQQVIEFAPSLDGASDDRE